MLRKLALHGVGPASSLTMDPVAKRLNLITGDNGLGKSFLLEAAWWALTRTWHESPAVPNRPDAKIEHHFDGASGVSKTPSKWSPEAQEWKRREGRPPNPGLVLYARVDGSFSVWDPLRNYRLYTRADGGKSESPSAYQFDTRAVLWGLKRSVAEAGATREQLLCRGLVDDWNDWQRSEDARFDLLKRLLAALGPDGQPLEPGDPLRPSIDDVREIPTIRMPYGQNVPITYAPAGVRRMCKLAYLLAWALSEHQAEASRTKKAPSDQVIMLVDEIETHLHPRWQRTVLPSLMTALGGWRVPGQRRVVTGGLMSNPIGGGRNSIFGNPIVGGPNSIFPSKVAPPHNPTFQFLVATHSPLVLASVEPQFDPSKDALWKLDLVDGDVQIERDTWHKRGDVQMWLRSDVFDETSGYSVEAERKMQDAAELMASEKASEQSARKMRAELAAVLADTDAFWLGFRAWWRARGWSQ